MISRIIQSLEQHGLLKAVHIPFELAEWQGLVQTDHRAIKPGEIFVCIKGERFDGHKVIPEALAKGAAIVVSQEEPQGDYPSLWVTDTRMAAAVIARITMLPEKLPYTLIGITGTNGKTTTSLIIYQALRKLGFKCGWIGTLGYYIDDRLFATQHTTPDIIQLNSIFALMAESGCIYIVMEVSSHALSLDRVYGVNFDYCLFSNLSRDHLDFHGDMTSYAEAKFSFFATAVRNQAVSIINNDDAFGEKIACRLAELSADFSTVGKAAADYQIDNIVNTLQGSSFEIELKTKPAERLRIQSRLIGAFNVQNLALMAASLHRMGFSLAQIADVARAIEPVKGRVESVSNSCGIGVYIDYAHTPDALENLLRSVAELPHQRILCLIGAGGDRDKGKRPLMLRSALNYSDAVIISDDNPRTENPEAIIRDMVHNSDLRQPWWIIRNRRLAIQAILGLANPGDLVLICGKGHEDYQEIEGVRQPFSDQEEARQALENRSDSMSKAEDEFVLPLDDTLLQLLMNPDWNPPERGYHEPLCYRHLSTDSRKLKSGSVFVALKGENFDGNDYAEIVLKDAENIVVSDCLPAQPRVVKTDSSLEAMGRIIRKYLQMFDTRCIALTGSTGKTTTKELIAAILETQSPILKTQANENNLIGVCKTALRIQPEHKYAIFELGTNHHGEIAALAEVINPDYALIINIGPSHLEYFGDEEGVFREKSILFKRPLALRLYPGDDDRFKDYFSTGTGVGFGENLKYRISQYSVGEHDQSFIMRGRQWIVPTNAPHMLLNAAFAIALALELGITAADIQTGLSRYANPDMRMQVERRGDRILIVDCYNANPVSMQAAIEYWKSLSPQLPHVAILGDMLELGDSSIMYHQMIGAMLAETDYHCLITVGNHAKLFCHAPQPDQPVYRTPEELVSSGRLSLLPQQAVILIKASHGIHLERLLPLLRREN